MVSMTEPLPVLCPECRGLLAAQGTTAACSRRHGYPMLLGRIIDLLPGQADLTMPRDRELVDLLVARFDSASFAGLNDLFHAHLGSVREDLRAYYASYARASIERNARMTAAFRARAGQAFDLSAAGAAIELGCGYGGNLVVLAGLYGHVAGIDASLPRLILAAKLLDEQGISHVRLVRTLAQRLPFEPSTFDYATAINVMEHVMEPQPVMDAVWECLRAGGVFVADSRNRYDLFFREPHVKLRWVGFLPRRWVKRYVRWRTGQGYENIRLLSYGEWRRILQPGRWRGRIVLAPVEAYGYSQRLGRVIERLAEMPVLGRGLLAIAPSHLVMAQKRAA